MITYCMYHYSPFYRSLWSDQDHQREASPDIGAQELAHFPKAQTYNH